MKKSYSIMLLSLILGLGKTYAQNFESVAKNVMIENKSLTSLYPLTPAPTAGILALFEPQNGTCITPEQENEIKSTIQRNIELLKVKNPKAFSKNPAAHPQFILPIQPKAGFTDYGYYGIFNLVDHNPAYPNQLLDYLCGTRTYDWNGGNHAGTDYVLWPYSWRRMDEQVMEVRAAAAGVIVNKVDGNYDRSCENNGGGTWNSIYLYHPDGSTTWYLHFKSGSLTTKSIGDSVETGEFLGTAGSSGSSTIPHLHFQVFDSNDNLIDPYDGICNNYNGGDSWWQSQPGYMEPAINHISTHYTVLYNYNCPNPEITFEKDVFSIGDSIIFRVFYRDLDFNAATTLSILTPSSEIAWNWNFNSPWSFSTATYASWSNVISSWWVTGEWTWQAEFNGQTYQHHFHIADHTGISENRPGSAQYSITPNPADNEVEIRQLVTNANPTELKLYNLMGQEVYSSAFSDVNLRIRTSDFPAGIYFLNLKSQNSISKQKLVIQH